MFMHHMMVMLGAISLNGLWSLHVFLMFCLLTFATATEGVVGCMLLC